MHAWAPSHGSTDDIAYRLNVYIYHFVGYNSEVLNQILSNIKQKCWLIAYHLEEYIRLWQKFFVSVAAFIRLTTYFHEQNVPMKNIC